MLDGNGTTLGQRQYAVERHKALLARDGVIGVGQNAASGLDEPARLPSLLETAGQVSGDWALIEGRRMSRCGTSRRTPAVADSR